MAVRHNRDVIVANDLGESRDRIPSDLVSRRMRCPLGNTGRRHAHEAGHALVAYNFNEKGHDGERWILWACRPVATRNRYVSAKC